MNRHCLLINIIISPCWILKKIKISPKFAWWTINLNAPKYNEYFREYLFQKDTSVPFIYENYTLSVDFMLN